MTLRERLENKSDDRFTYDRFLYYCLDAIEREAFHVTSIENTIEETSILFALFRTALNGPSVDVDLLSKINGAILTKFSRYHKKFDFRKRNLSAYSRSIKDNAIDVTKVVETLTKSERGLQKKKRDDLLRVVKQHADLVELSFKMIDKFNHYAS